METPRSPLPEEHLAQLDRLARTYWWHVHRVRTVLQLAARFLPARPLRYLDMGCGPGSTTRAVAEGLRGLGRMDARPLGVDNDPRLKEPCLRNGVEFILGDLDSGVLAEDVSGVGFFTLLDVAEHLEEPRRLLQALAPRLEPGAVGIAAVPAYQGLYSSWDARLGHLRRYTLGGLGALLDGSGYEVLWGSYLFAFALPPAFVSRRLLRGGRSEKAEFPEVPDWLNAALKAACCFERLWLRAGRCPFGTTAVAVVRKKE
jgi:SAM-dependent methyltransferase